MGVNAAAILCKYRNHNSILTSHGQIQMSKQLEFLDESTMSFCLTVHLFITQILFLYYVANALYFHSMLPSLPKPASVSASTR